MWGQWMPKMGINLVTLAGHGTHWCESLPGWQQTGGACFFCNDWIKEVPHLKCKLYHNKGKNSIMDWKMVLCVLCLLKNVLHYMTSLCEFIWKQPIYFCQMWTRTRSHSYTSPVAWRIVPGYDNQYLRAMRPKIKIADWWFIMDIWWSQQWNHACVIWYRALWESSKELRQRPQNQTFRKKNSAQGFPDVFVSFRCK
jgi:hypothetical protein